VLAALTVTVLLAVVPCRTVRAAGALAGPTVREVIEFTRIIQPLNHDDVALQSQRSPDGTQAFIVTRRADVASDVNRFEILLLDVDPRHLEAGVAREPRRLLTVEARQDSNDADPPLREVRWADDRTLVFRARVRDAPFQAYRLEIATRRVRQLTHEPHGLVSFDVSRDLKRVVYVARVPNPPMPAGARGVVAGTNSFWSIHFGQSSYRSQQRRFRYMVTQAGSRQPARPLGEAFGESSGGFADASISPDGRWALLPRYEPARQVAWGRQYPRVAELTAAYGPSVNLDPLAYYSRPQAYVPRRMVAYRLADGQEQAVLDAPDDSMQTNQRRTDRLWLADGRSVVIAGTFLPRSAGESGLPSGSHIIEYWPDSGRWQMIAALKRSLKTAVALTDRSDGFVAIDGDEQRRFERDAQGRWRESGVASLNGAAGASDGRAEEVWRLRVDEALNQPPDIVAGGPAGRTVRLTALNPQYDADRWGAMRPYSWTDAKGRTWNGGLMVPAGFDPTVRHALVIQTYGFSPTRFYRDGANTYDGHTSGFPGRAFLRENIVVLAMHWAAASGGPDDHRGQTLAFADGVRAAIDALVAEGVVNRDRIGIMGWSATGEQVLNLLTFSDTPVRAATLLDGDANTLFSLTVTYAVQDGIQIKKERANQGGPYGESLGRWIRNDPSLHTDCIRAALRIETYGPEVKNNWDIYALLRRQYKPVEMIRIPEGAHALSRPSERMLSLQGNVDWYRFWLLGERRSEPVLPMETPSSLDEQYARWTQMASLKQAADATPQCVRDATP
jgi:dipeptidyl aminopeptidase/acylaminoacyl peptidase